MRIFSLGDSALTIELGSEISAELNRAAIGLAEYFSRVRFPGFIEAAPAYSSTTIFYDVRLVRKKFPEFPSAFAAVGSFVESGLSNADPSDGIESRIVEIPVDLDGSNAPDLDDVCAYSGLTREAVIDLFLSRTYRVYMLGFLPGFAYMGEVDDLIAAPHLETPRQKVPKGSVGIAGKQTGIYPFESPGGWNLIGRTKMEMFDPNSGSPCSLRPGDEVRFVRVA